MVRVVTAVGRSVVRFVVEQMGEFDLVLGLVAVDRLPQDRIAVARSLHGDVLRQSHECKFIDQSERSTVAIDECVDDSR